MSDADLVAQAAALLRSGGVVAFPTETVYGLGANALDSHAIRRVFQIKGRPSTSPLIVHAATVEMLRKFVVREWPEEAVALAGLFWPGPLTLVLPKQEAIPDEVTANLETVGVRIPRHPLALDLLQQAGIPIAAPSANLFTQLSPTTADHVRSGLGVAVDLILDGGPCAVGIESTVVSLTEPGRPVLLRPGAIGKSTLEEAIGPIQVVSKMAEAHAAPGLHPRHYRPKTPLFLGEQSLDDRTVLLSRDEFAKAPNIIAMPKDPGEYATRLYDILHEVDRQNWARIVVEPLPDEESWDAVRDRLRRASEG